MIMLAYGRAFTGGQVGRDILPDFDMSFFFHLGCGSKCLGIYIATAVRWFICQPGEIAMILRVSSLMVPNFGLSLLFFFFLIHYPRGKGLEDIRSQTVALGCHVVLNSYTLEGKCDSNSRFLSGKERFLSLS